VVTLAQVRVCGIARRTPKRKPHHNNLQKRVLYFYILKKYRIIKIKDNNLEFRCFLNNLINRKGMLGLCMVVGFRLGVRRAMPQTLTKISMVCSSAIP
jgi:hypothetical protein